MNKTTTTLAALALTTITVTATAGQQSMSSGVFAAQDNDLMLAQSEAVMDYNRYLHDMMMKDGNMMRAMDANHDGEISDKEFRQTYERVFQSFDTNGDHMIDKSEMKHEMSSDTGEG